MGHLSLMPYDQELRFGIPSGSFNDPSRAHTEGVLIQAGLIPLKGTGANYRPGQESGPIPLKDEKYDEQRYTGLVVHPKDAPLALAEGKVDIAIFGSDWFREFNDHRINKKFKRVRKICDLAYAEGTIVIAAQWELVRGACGIELVRDPVTGKVMIDPVTGKELMRYITSQKEVLEEDIKFSLTDFFKHFRIQNGKGLTEQIVIGSEYPAHAQNCIMQNYGYREIFGKNVAPLVYRLDVPQPPQGTNEQVKIFISHGKTETWAYLGAKLIIDLKQTGGTLDLHNLVQIDTVRTAKTQAGLYAGPSCVDWKQARAEDIGERLQAAAQVVEPQRLQAVDIIRRNSNSPYENLKEIMQATDIPRGLYNPLLAKELVRRMLKED